MCPDSLQELVVICLFLFVVLIYIKRNHMDVDQTVVFKHECMLSLFEKVSL